MLHQIKQQDLMEEEVCEQNEQLIYALINKI